MKVALAALMLLGAALPVRAQMDSREGIQLQNQILELRRDLQILQAQRGGYAAQPPVVYPGGGSGGGGGELTAQLLDRVQALEEAVRQMRGELDQQINADQRAQADLAKQIGDLQFRLQNGTPAPAAAAPAPPSLSPQPSTLGAVPTGPSATSAQPPRRPEIAIAEGNAALGRHDYPAAEAAAREVLGNSRGSPRAADANFLLAQALMGERNYQAAAVAYDDSYNRNRTGGRAPESLFGLANALTGLGERPAACATLDKLRVEFPSPRPEVRDAAASLRARNGCGRP